jgi:diaminohydroxyphosphoribosylaminopyrimidine deaminase/5-amino-6-(5-phosphoribosylamino)uracil reductase
MVGAVIVAKIDGAEILLGEGWHSKAGSPHAESDALSNVNGQTAGATLYVSLEPCCHHGRTPPCTDSILEAGISRVVVGMVDPNPIVQGKGIALLRNAGIEVVVGVEENACIELNAGYVKAIYQGRPRVWLKAAATLDGRIADHMGVSQWITGEEARLYGHRIRDRVDAIMVGSGTLHSDDPSLTTRFEGGRDALPVVLDTNLTISAEAKLLSSSKRAVIYCAEDAPQRDIDADIVRVKRSDSGLDLHAIMRDLATRDVHNLMVEGGGRLNRALLEANLVDRLLMFVAPKVLVGGAGFIGGEPLGLDEGYKFTLLSATRLGVDVLLDYKVER